MQWGWTGGQCPCRHHYLFGSLQGDKRADIQLNSFGFYTNGSLEVELSLLRLGLQETKGNLPRVRWLMGRLGAHVLVFHLSPVPHSCYLLKPLAFSFLT